jgi:Phosphoesterase family
MASDAYKKGGLLIINFDEGEAQVQPNPAGGFVINFPGLFCCNEQPSPNLGAFSSSSIIGTLTLFFGSYGGDRTGAVLLSPLLKPGSVSEIPFNHYSLLRTVEDIFDIDEHLGYAGQQACSAVLRPTSAPRTKAAPAFPISSSKPASRRQLSLAVALSAAGGSSARLSLVTGVQHSHTSAVHAASWPLVSRPFMASGTTRERRSPRMAAAKNNHPAPDSTRRGAFCRRASIPRSSALAGPQLRHLTRRGSWSSYLQSQPRLRYRPSVRRSCAVRSGDCRGAE